MNKRKRIVIDPGHGGTDRWNRGPTKYIEADGVLKISRYLKEELEETGFFEVKLTREVDRTLTLGERAMIGKDFKADMLISQHTNGFNGKVGGSEVFYSVKRPKDKSTAAKMAKDLARFFNTANRGAKTRKNDYGNDYYGVIRDAERYKIPSILLVESLFHDNPREEKFLLQEKYLEAIARIQCEVILEHFGFEELPVIIEEDLIDEVQEKEILYRVQTGAFLKEKNALRQEKDLLKKGFLTYLFQEEGFYKVQVGAFRVRKNAERMRSELKGEGFDAFITEKEEDKIQI